MVRREIPLWDVLIKVRIPELSASLVKICGVVSDYCKLNRDLQQKPIMKRMLISL